MENNVGERISREEKETTPRAGELLPHSRPRHCCMQHEQFEYFDQRVREGGEGIYNNTRMREIKVEHGKYSDDEESNYLLAGVLLLLAAPQKPWLFHPYHATTQTVLCELS